MLKSKHQNGYTNMAVVQDSVYDKFVECFIKATEAYQVGDPLDPNTFQGPQVSQKQVSNRYQAFIKDSNQSAGNACF